jgi:hypothetical protein
MGDAIDIANEHSEKLQNQKDMFSSESIPEKKNLLSANAYFGAKPICAALDNGCDIVITGRCVDSALVLGILMHEFGWGKDGGSSQEILDLYSQGTLAGHLVECGCQGSGGLNTDWTETEWVNPG